MLLFVLKVFWLVGQFFKIDIQALRYEFQLLTGIGDNLCYDNI